MLAVSKISAAHWSADDRRQLAGEAALGVTARLGIYGQRAVILEDWNNTIVRLAPVPIVVKVGTSHFRDACLESLERELVVAAYLAARGAPVVRPAQQVPPGPHYWRGLTLSLWELVEPIPDVEPAPAEIAAALKVTHEALSEFDESLPCFASELDDARMLLQQHRSPSLADVDRGFLLSVVDELQAALVTSPDGCRPLHGSPHGANWLISADGPLLLDFETACVGPVEWDLAALRDEALGFFPHADHELIRTMRRMRSVCVVAKCSVAPERAPQLREAASVHLKLLRGQRLD